MPLGVRDVLLVLRARDQAGRIISDVGRQFGNLEGAAAAAAMSSIRAGTAVAGVGIAMTALGVAGLEFYADAINASKEYNQSAALTLTQVDQLGVGLEDIKRIGKDVAEAIPAPFEQMQASLFDIFSSMDVNVAGAQTLLEGFARAAVAGQVEVQTAGRATIAIMNAFKIPVEEVNRVLDVQFEAVRKGVFTYEEFATAIGRAIPSAQRAGQSIETLASMMAFLTRNGLSADQAATSTARAFDLLSNPKFQDRMQAFGIAVFDTAGNFRPMLDVVTELRERLSTMTPEDQTQILADLTKGAGGVIQAMRFLNLAVNDTNGQFGSLFESINGATGSLDAAYNIMFEQPATQAQLFRNNLAILRTEIGDIFLPLLGRAVEVGLTVIRWFQDLDPNVKRAIIIFGAIASVMLVVVGVITTLVGVFMILSGTLVLLGTTLGHVILIGLGISAALIAIIAVGYLLWRNWDTIKKVAGVVWQAIQQFVQDTWQKLQDFWDWLSTAFVGIWQSVSSGAADAWGDVIKIVQTAQRNIQAALQAVQRVAMGIWDWFNKHFGQGFRDIFGAAGEAIVDIGVEIYETFIKIVEVVQFLWDILSPIFSAWLDFHMVLASTIMDFVSNAWEPAWSLAQTIFEQVWNAITTFFANVASVIGVIFDTIIAVGQAFIGTFVAAFTNFKDVFVSIFSNTWSLVSAIVSNFITIISNAIQLFLNIIQGDWGEAWDNIKNIFAAAWDAIWGALQAVWGLIQDFFVRMPSSIVGFIGDVGRLLWDKGGDILRSLWNGISEIWTQMYQWLTQIPAGIVSAIGDLSRILWNAGRALIQGLIDGAKSLIGNLAKMVKDALGDLVGLLPGSPVKEGPLRVLNNGYAGGQIIQMLINGIQAAAPMLQDALDTTLMALNTSPELNLALDANINAPVGIVPERAGDVYVQAGAIQIHDARDPDAVADAVAVQFEEVIRELTVRTP